MISWLEEKKKKKMIIDITTKGTPINVFSHIQGAHPMQNLDLFMLNSHFKIVNLFSNVK